MAVIDGEVIYEFNFGTEVTRRDNGQVRVFLETTDMLDGMVERALLHLDPQATKLVLLNGNLTLVDRPADEALAQLFAETIDNGLRAEPFH